MGFFRDLVDEVKYASVCILKGAAVVGVMTVCIVVGYNTHADMVEGGPPPDNYDMQKSDILPQEPQSEYAQELFSDPGIFHSYP